MLLSLRKQVEKLVQGERANAAEAESRAAESERRRTLAADRFAAAEACRLSELAQLKSALSTLATAFASVAAPEVRKHSAFAFAPDVEKGISKQLLTPAGLGVLGGGGEEAESGGSIGGRLFEARNTVSRVASGTRPHHGVGASEEEMPDEKGPEKVSGKVFETEDAKSAGVGSAQDICGAGVAEATGGTHAAAALEEKLRQLEYRCAQMESARAQELAERERENAEKTSEINELRALLEKKQVSLAGKDAEIVRLTQSGRVDPLELQRQQKERAEGQAQLLATEQQLNASLKKASQQQLENFALKQALAKAKANGDALQQSLETKISQLSRLDADLATRDEAMRRVQAEVKSREDAHAAVSQIVTQICRWNYCHPLPPIISTRAYTCRPRLFTHCGSKKALKR
jgi:hypothetical protein